MKILVISHLYPTKENSVRGNYVYSQTKWLKSIGHEVDVVIPFGTFFGRTKDNNPLGEIAETHITPYPTFSNPGLLFVDKFIAKRIRKILNISSYDLILAHTVLPDGATALRLGKKYQKPVALYVHGADVQNKVGIWYLKGKILKTILRVNLTLVNSLKTSNLVKTFTKIEPRIAYLGVEKIKEYPKPKNKKIKILSVGNLIEQKGHDYSIKAVKEMLSEGHNLSLEIIGDGPEMENLQNLIDGIEDIKLLGKKDNDFVHKKLAEADIFLLPSWNEAFGVVYLEALWQKTPIIGIQGQGVEDILKYGKCGVLAKPENIDSVKDAIKNLIDKNIRLKYGEVGRKIVEKHFLWENNIKVLDKYLKEVIR